MYTGRGGWARRGDASLRLVSQTRCGDSITENLKHIGLVIRSRAELGVHIGTHLEPLCWIGCGERAHVPQSRVVDKARPRVAAGIEQEDHWAEGAPIQPLECHSRTMAEGTAITHFQRTTKSPGAGKSTRDWRSLVSFRGADSVASLYARQDNGFGSATRGTARVFRVLVRTR